jgi:hypothetical protein
MESTRDETQLIEQAYEKFCSGEISREELLKAMELASMFSLSNYLTTQMKGTSYERVREDYHTV